MATNALSMPRGNEVGPCVLEPGDSRLPGKASQELTAVLTVPETDTGGWGEHPKALERTRVKELGKLTP